MGFLSEMKLLLSTLPIFVLLIVDRFYIAKIDPSSALEALYEILYVGLFYIMVIIIRSGADQKSRPLVDEVLFYLGLAAFGYLEAAIIAVYPEHFLNDNPNIVSTFIVGTGIAYFVLFRFLKR